VNKFWVIDTNILVSALLHPQGNERQAVVKASQTGIILCSPQLKQEYLRVLTRKKFDKYVSLETRLELYAIVLEDALELHPTQKVNLCRDSKDNMLLELALEARADAVITGDKDLLVLHPFSDIPIITAAGFAALV
jgi:uncharacterized protein